MRFDIPCEEIMMLDRGHVEHSVGLDGRKTSYPFEEMAVLDYFRIETFEESRRTRAAINRYREKEPATFFVVRQYDDEWVCRRVM